MGEACYSRRSGLIKTRLPVAFSCSTPPRRSSPARSMARGSLPCTIATSDFPFLTNGFAGIRFGRNDRTLRIEEQMAEERSWRPEQRGQQSGPKNKMGQ